MNIWNRTTTKTSGSVLRYAVVCVLLACLLAAGPWFAAPAAADAAASDDAAVVGTVALKKVVKEDPLLKTTLVSRTGALTSMHSSNGLSAASSADAYQIALAAGTTDLRNFSVTYQNAVSCNGKQFDERLTFLSAESDQTSVLTISKTSPTYQVNGIGKTISDGDRIAAIARKYGEHEPHYRYVLGGSSFANGIDCAHFVGRVYEEAGIDIISNGAWANVRTLRTVLKKDIVLSRDSGKPVDMTKAKPGDIIIFFTRGGRDSHTAIYLGNDEIAHAQDPSGGVCVRKMNYDQSTGITGYNGKYIQYVIRPYGVRTLAAQGSAAVHVRVELLDPVTGRVVRNAGIEMQLTDIESGEGWSFERTDPADAIAMDDSFGSLLYDAGTKTVRSSENAPAGNDASVTLSSRELESGSFTVTTTSQLSRATSFTHAFRMPNRLLGKTSGIDLLKKQA